MHESPRLLGGGIHVAPPGRDFPPHEHRSWELVYYASGRARCPIGDETYDVTPGTVLLTPPGTRHAELTTTGYTNRYVQVDAPASRPWPRIVFDDGDASLGRVFDALVRETTRRTPGSDRLAELLLAELDLLLARSREADHLTVGERVVAEAERLMEEGFAAGLRIADVADGLGVSPSALRAYFARHRGTSPRAYVQSVRLRHALNYVRNSTLTLQAIADLCGYDSVSHLSRHVKASTGSAPGTLRRRRIAHV